MSGFQYYHNAPNCQQNFYGYSEQAQTAASQLAEAPASGNWVDNSPSLASGEGDDLVMFNASVKVLSSTNKKAFTVYMLRGITAEHFTQPNTLREEIFRQLGEAVVSRRMDFHIGYFNRNVKLWINNKQDSRDACKILTSTGKLTLWCIGIPPEKSGSKRGRGSIDITDSCSDDDDESSAKKKKCGHAEERSARVKELKAKLQRQHGSDYSATQYTLWAEMLVGETHDSFDTPPQVPMFGMIRARGRHCSDPNTALDCIADRITATFSPHTVPVRSVNNSSSPSKNAELCSNYMQQLRELVNLQEMGALTSEEYEDQRLALVDLMKGLNTPRSS